MEFYFVLLANGCIAVSVLTAMVAGIRYQRLSAALRGLALLMLLDALIQVLSEVLYELHRPNLLLYPVVLLGEAALLLYTYRLVLRQAAFNRVAPWLLGLYGGLVVLDTCLFFGHQHQFALSQVGSDLLGLGLAGLYFRKLLHELHAERLRHEPFFWVSAGLMIYALGDLFVSLFSNFLMAYYSRTMQLIVLSGVHNFFTLLLYAAYLKALLLRPAPTAAA